VIDKLASALSEVIDSPEFKGRLEKLAAQPPSSEERGPAPFKKLLERDTARVAGLVKQMSLVPE
jgi:tripartite-type tricarboxylate transporter receptor subunit TctC